MGGKAAIATTARYVLCQLSTAEAVKHGVKSEMRVNFEGDKNWQIVKSMTIQVSLTVT